MRLNTLKKVIPAAILALSLAACGAANNSTTAEKPAESPAAVETTAAEENQNTEAAAEENSAGAETAAPAAESSAEAQTTAALTDESPSAAAEETPALAEVAAQDGLTIENGAMVLSVPSEYMDLLIIETPADDPDGILFKVSEKASVEAAKAQGEEMDGPGWLFSIGTESEEAVQEDLCSDMSGKDVFARAEDGTYFVMYHPSDVRFVREQYENIEEDMKQWSMLNEWGSSVKESFVTDNAGLTPERHSNTGLDVYLARIAYKNDVAYTISSLEHGVKEPGDTDPASFVSRMINGAVFTYADGEEAPDGEYVVLAIPEDNVRYDFFFMDGKQNFVREVREIEGETYETLYEATFENGTDTANEIMNEWYQALPGGEH